MNDNDANIVEDDVLIEDQPGNATESQAEPEKLFSQAELDKIIQRRLLNEKTKHESELKKIESEFKHKEYTLNAERELLNRGYPPELLAAFSADSVDELSKHLDVVDNIVSQRTEDIVNARLRGNVPKAATGRPDIDNGFRAAFGLNP